MTAAARSFWPRVAGSDEKRRPAPFGSDPCGRSIVRAAAATADASNAASPAPEPAVVVATGSTRRNSAQAAEYPASASSDCSAVASSAGPWIVYSALPYRSPAVLAPSFGAFAQSAANLAYAAAASEFSAPAWKPAVG